MPAIWNVNSAYNINNKKVSSKLTFEVGEKFSGRIISKGEGKEAVVKLTDGWQFEAEIDGEISGDGHGVVRFEVEGFEDGKLKLKIVNRQTQGETVAKDSVADVVSKTGLSKEDMSILKEMVKHNMPLTKENVNLIKGLIQFNDKINSNPAEIKNFIEKFLNVKGVEANSEQGKLYVKALEDFMKAFKSMSSEEVFLFLENDIEFSKENIDSFNKLFKSDKNLHEYFKGVESELKQLNTEQSLDKNIMKDIQKADNKDIVQNTSKDIVNNTSKDILQNTSKDILQNTSKDILQNTSKDIQLNNKYTDQGVINEIGKNISKDIDVDINKEALYKNIENLENAEIDIQNTSNSKIASKVYDSNDVSKGKISMLSLLKSMSGDDNSIIKDTLKNIILDRTSTFTSNEVNNINNTITNLSDEKVLDIFKNCLADNGKPITKEQFETALKDFTGKEIKLSEVEFKKLNDVLTVKLSGNPETATIQKKDGETLNQVTNKIIQDIEVDLKLTSKDIIKDDIKSKLDFIKNVAKELLNQAEIKGGASDKVMQFLKNNMNDFKLLNSINNEYYYLDLPIKREDVEYPCKLIIKDNRKDGKKIDKTNVKLVVVVKTVNIGTVDGYLKVNNKHLDIDLKCDKGFVKPLNLGKTKLIEGLETLGFTTNIVVSKRAEEVGLARCREFFNDNNTTAIDTKV